MPPHTKPSTELLIVVNRICNKVVAFDLPVTRGKIPRPNDLWWSIRWTRSSTRARTLCFQQVVVCRDLQFFIIIKPKFQVIILLLHLLVPSQQAWVIVHVLGPARSSYLAGCPAPQMAGGDFSSEKLLLPVSIVTKCLSSKMLVHIYSLQI